MIKAINVKHLYFQALGYERLLYLTYTYNFFCLRTCTSELDNEPRTNTNGPQRTTSETNVPPNTQQLMQTFAIKQDSQAFFLKAKAVRKYKYSTVQSALWQSQYQTIGRKYHTQQPALRQMLIL